jgi:hypothetical protein
VITHRTEQAENAEHPRRVGVPPVMDVYGTVDTALAAGRETTPG